MSMSLNIRGSVLYNDDEILNVNIDHHTGMCNAMMQYYCRWEPGLCKSSHFVEL